MPYSVFAVPHGCEVPRQTLSRVTRDVTERAVRTAVRVADMKGRLWRASRIRGRPVARRHYRADVGLTL